MLTAKQTAGPRVSAGHVTTLSPVVVGSQGVISTVHLLQENAQLPFIQVQAVQDAALLDQVEEEDRQCVARGGFSKCKDIKLPAAVCALQVQVKHEY